jgi:hypothetical protein
MRWESLKPYEPVAILTALALLAALLTFVMVRLVGVSEKVERIESQLHTLDTKLNNAFWGVDAANKQLASQRKLIGYDLVGLQTGSVEEDLRSVKSDLQELKLVAGRTPSSDPVGLSDLASIRRDLEDLKSQMLSCIR